MSALKEIPKFKTADVGARVFQEAVAKTATDLANNSLVNGILIKDVALTAGQSVLVEHKLGREPRGFVVTNPNAPIMLWRLPQTNKRFLNLYATAPNGNTFTFTDGDVNTGTEIIQETDHRLDTGTPVALSNSGGSLPAPFVEGQTYYVLWVSSSTFSLMTAPNNTSGINITSAAGGGTHTLTKVCTTDLWVF